MAIRTKVARTDLIVRLNETVTNNAKAVKENERKRKELARLKTAHNKAFLKTLKPEAIEEINVNRYYRNSSVMITLDKDFPIAEFEAPKDLELEGTLGDWEIKEIQQAIKVLEMSSEQDISMSALKDVIKYL